MNFPDDRDAEDTVDPQIRAFQKSIAAGYAAHPDLATMSLAQVRGVAESVRRPWVVGGPEMVSVRELRVGALGTRVRILRASRKSQLPGLVYLHGGGWTMFSIDTHDRLMREYAARSGCAVIGVDYSRAPEAKYPRALEETTGVVEWLRGNGPAHGIDPDRLAVGGDSAGANLAMASQLRLRDRGEATVSAMLLNYGVYTDQASASTERYDGSCYMLQTDEMDGFWDNYLRADQDRGDPLVMPLRADPHDLPPTFMVVAACDILADGNHAMAAALRKAGVAVHECVYQHATHSFLEAVSVSGIADRALEESSHWLQRQLSS